MWKRLKRFPLVAAYYRRRYPDIAMCYKCGLPITVAGEPHFVDMDSEICGSDGFFTSCEHCWGKMSYAEKMRSCLELFRRWSKTRNGCTYPTLGQMLDALDREENAGMEFEHDINGKS